MSCISHSKGNDGRKRSFFLRGRLEVYHEFRWTIHDNLTLLLAKDEPFLYIGLQISSQFQRQSNAHHDLQLLLFIITFRISLING